MYFLYICNPIRVALTPNRSNATALNHRRGTKSGQDILYRSNTHVRTEPMHDFREGYEPVLAQQKR